MVDVNCIMPVELPAGATNAELRCTGHGVADFAPLPIASRLLSGGALQPPSPCKLTATRTGTQIVVEWVRRRFRQWHWIDGIGDVADAFPELYRITIATMNSTRILEVAGQSALLAPPVIPDQAGQPISISVATVGPSALSHPFTTTIVT